MLAVASGETIGGSGSAGGSESGLQGPSPFLPGVAACVVRSGRTCKREREEICFLPDRVSLARVSGNLLAEDCEARGASFRTGVQQCRRDDSSDSEEGKQAQIALRLF